MRKVPDRMRYEAKLLVAIDSERNVLFRVLQRLTMARATSKAEAGGAFSLFGGSIYGQYVEVSKVRISASLVNRPTENEC